MIKFFAKIFKKTPQETILPISTNSDQANIKKVTSSATIKRNERRLEPRIEVEFDEKLEFYILVNGQKIKTQVENISSQGLGIKKTEEMSFLIIDSAFNGILQRGAEEVSVRIIVKWNKSDHIGCRVEPVSSEFKQIFLDFFSFEMNSLKIVKMRTNILDNIQGLTPWWYKSMKGHELFLVESQGNILRFHLNLREYYVECLDLKSLHCFKIIADLDHGSGQINMLPLQSIPLELKTNCRKFILRIDQIQPDQREILLKFFE